MKKLLSAILVVATILCLSMSALAENPYISNPELQDSHTKNMEMYHKYESERNQLDAQFKIDNPTVYKYTLSRTSWNSNVFESLFGSLYVGYTGSGYYCVRGYTTVYSGVTSYTATVLGPDPKPSVTAEYVKQYSELTALMNKYYAAAEDNVISSIDQDSEMLRKIKDWYEKTYYDASSNSVDPNKSVYLIFQIGNYMYSAGEANRTSFFWGMIEQGNRESVPYAVNGNTMIPIRPLVEGLGGSVDWDEELNGARATLDGNSITIPIGSEYAYVNNEPVKMTTPAVIANGKTMIPLRFVAENLDYDVEWVPEGQFVLIKESTRLHVLRYEYSVPEGTYQWGYSLGNRRTWSYDVYVSLPVYHYIVKRVDGRKCGVYEETGEEHKSLIDTVNVECENTTEPDINESHEFNYVMTTNEVDVYEEIIDKENSYERYLMFKNNHTDKVLLVHAEYDSSEFQVDETRLYGDINFNALKNDALDNIIDTIIESIDVVWGNKRGEAVG